MLAQHAQTAEQSAHEDQGLQIDELLVVLRARTAVLNALQAAQGHASPTWRVQDTAALQKLNELMWLLLAPHERIHVLGWKFLAEVSL